MAGSPATGEDATDYFFSTPGELRKSGLYVIERINEQIKTLGGEWTKYSVVGSFRLYLLGYLSLRFHLSAFGVTTDLVLPDNASEPIAEISLAAKTTDVVPGDVGTDAAAALLDEVRGQDRTYGGTNLVVRPQQRRSSDDSIEWIEIFVQRNHDAPHQITSCDGSNCGQPALSSTGTRVAYIREKSP